MAPRAWGTRSCREKGSRLGSFVLQTPPFLAPPPPAKRVQERTLAADSHLPGQAPITGASRRSVAPEAGSRAGAAAPGVSPGTRVPVCSLPSNAGFSPRPLSEAAQKCGSRLPPADPAAKGSRHRGATPGAWEEPKFPRRPPQPSCAKPWGCKGCAGDGSRAGGLVPSTQRFSYLFLPTVSWSFTTTVSSAPGSRGAPFRSHSKPWRGGERSHDQHLYGVVMLTLTSIGSGTTRGGEPEHQTHFTITALTAQTSASRMPPTEFPSRPTKKPMSQAKAFPSSRNKSEGENNGSWHTTFLC